MAKVNKTIRTSTQTPAQAVTEEKQMTEQTTDTPASADETNATEPGAAQEQTEATDTSAPAAVDQGVKAPVEEASAAIQAPAPVVKAEVVEEVPAISDFQFAVGRIMTSGTTAQRGLVSALELYLSKMAPGIPMDNDKGAANQYGLWMTLATILNGDSAEFKSLWNIVLAFFHEHKNGVCHERYIFRFAEYWNRPEHALQAFQRILNLIKLTADVKGREHGLKQIDLTRTLAIGITEEGRQKVLAFYGK